MLIVDETDYLCFLSAQAEKATEGHKDAVEVTEELT
jgi:hypothetical protein